MQSIERVAPPTAGPANECVILDDVRASAKLAAMAGAFFIAGAVMLPALLLNGVDYWAGWSLGLIFLVVGGGLLLQIVPIFASPDPVPGHHPDRLSLPGAGRPAGILVGDRACQSVRRPDCLYRLLLQT